MMGRTCSTPVMDLRCSASTLTSSPTTPMTVRYWPRERWACRPRASIWETMSLTRASEALGWRMTIMGAPCDFGKRGIGHYGEARGEREERQKTFQSGKSEGESLQYAA